MDSATRIAGLECAVALCALLRDIWLFGASVQECGRPSEAPLCNTMLPLLMKHVAPCVPIKASMSSTPAEDGACRRLDAVTSAMLPRASSKPRHAHPHHPSLSRSVPAGQLPCSRPRLRFCVIFSPTFSPPSILPIQRRGRFGVGWSSTSSASLMPPLQRRSPRAVPMVAALAVRVPVGAANASAAAARMALLKRASAAGLSAACWALRTGYSALAGTKSCGIGYSSR